MHGMVYLNKSRGEDYRKKRDHTTTPPPLVHTLPTQEYKGTTAHTLPTQEAASITHHTNSLSSNEPPDIAPVDIVIYPKPFHKFSQGYMETLTDVGLTVQHKTIDSAENKDKDKKQNSARTVQRFAGG